jgi:hypothetical protein
MRRHAILLIGLMLVQTAWADLHNPNNAADYLIISSGALIESTPWIHQLADWRANHGRTAIVVATDSIWNEFGTGTPSDSVLKDFLFYAYDHWSAPQLTDVFIIGWHDVVPMHIEQDSMSYPDSTGQIHWVDLDYPSDFFYTTNPNTDDLYPDLRVGRLPWSPTDSETPWDYYAKVIGYESASGEDWQRRVQIIADQQDSQFNFSLNFAEPVAALVHDWYTIERDYLDYPDGDPWHGDRDEVLDNLNAGNYLTFYLGHAGGGLWSGSNLVNYTDADSLQNGNRLPIVSAFGFDMGAYNDSVRLYPMARAFMSNPNGGAIAYFGVTPYTWALAGLNLRKIIVRIATNDPVSTLGDIWFHSLADYIAHYEGEMHGPGSSVRETAFGCVLFGDPGLRVPVRPHAIDAQRSAEIPYAIELLGNYPNPFNPTTRILFNVGKAGQVKLTVTNILGQAVAVLADSRYEVGQYSLEWNAAPYPSGLYFALLESDGVKHVQKMVLMK